MRVKVIHTESGKARMLAERLANDPAYMAAQGFVKAEVKKPIEKSEEAEKPAKKTTKKTTKK